MEIFYIIASVIALVVSVIAYLMGRNNINLTWVTALSIASILITLPIYPIWASIAKNDAQTFYEYWNGSEVATNSSSMTCYRDGSCVNTYNCDPYTVYETETYTDSEGKTKTRTVAKTKYHSCPYSQEETRYSIDTTVGAYDLGVFMTGEEFRWGVAIPGGRVTEPPTLWTEAKTRIDSGNPGAVTQINPYKNYILASDVTLFKEYSTEIENYSKKGLLPTPANSVYDLYKANKLYNVGVDYMDMEKFNTDLQYLNSAVGSNLHGDLHIVMVNADEVGDPTTYTNALNAYWTSKEVGKNAIAKNTITVVVGVEKYKKAPTVEEKPVESVEDSEQVKSEDSEVVTKQTDTIAVGTPVVAWAKSFTGMPLGNEALMTQISSDLKGKVIDEDFVGSAKFNVDTLEYEVSAGKVSDLIFGVNEFQRVSMSGSDSDDNGSGFEYLSEDWEPDEGTMVGIHIVSTIIFIICLFVAVMVGLNRSGYSSEDYLRDFIENFVNKVERK